VSIVAAAPPAPIEEAVEADVTGGPNRGLGVAKRVGKTVGQAALSLVVVLGFWQGFIWLADLDSFIAKGPADVWQYVTTDADAAENRQVLLDASLTTLGHAAIGFIAGTAAAVITAIVFTLRRGVEATFLPIALAFRVVPLVAMTPLIALIFGRGLLAVAIISGIVTFFPTLVNVSLALRSVPKESVDLFKAYGTTDLVMLRKLQMPAALPPLFASARIAAPLALIGALLAEWLATGDGLGYLMLRGLTTFKIDQVWASVAIVTLASVILYGIISNIEQAVLAKYAPDRDQTGVT
jgi:ABC-type nitrate/sulfonate/bicarbonate transport system permease component